MEWELVNQVVQMDQMDQMVQRSKRDGLEATVCGPDT